MRRDPTPDYIHKVIMCNVCVIKLVLVDFKPTTTIFLSFMFHLFKKITIKLN